MGSSSERKLALEEEQTYRQAKLPDALDDAIRIICELHDDVRAGQQQITVLQTELRKAGAWRAKLKDYIIGGIVGAIISAVITLLAT